MPTPKEQEIRERFYREFPDMECSSETQTAKVVADWWLKELQSDRQRLVGEIEAILHTGHTKCYCDRCELEQTIISLLKNNN